MTEYEDYYEIIPVSCEDRGIDEKYQNKLIIIKQEDFVQPWFKEPKKFYVVSGFGDRVYFKMNNRQLAQEMTNEIWGASHYNVREVIKGKL